MVALPARLDDAAAAAVAAEVADLAALVRARVPSWRWTSVALDDAPLAVKLLWDRVGWSDRLTAMMLSHPSRERAESVLAAHHVDRLAVPASTRVVHVDDGGVILLTDEDTERDDPPVVAHLVEQGRTIAHAPSYLRWATNVLVRCACSPWYRSGAAPLAMAWHGAAHPYPRCSPTTVAIADGVWRIPPDADERAPGTARVELAHRSFAELVAALSRALPRPSALQPSRAGDRVEVAVSVSELVARHGSLTAYGPGLAAGTIGDVSVIAVVRDGGTELTTDAGAGARLRGIVVS